MARFRDRPQDFEVEEELLYPPSGAGPYTLIQVEKIGLDTAEVGRKLARALGRRMREVGFAGRKDRHAVARQWFSLPDIAPDRALQVELEGVRVLEASRHSDRLRLGELLANRFVLMVCDVTAEDLDGLDARLDRLAKMGFANRFGSQRFGRDGDNASRGAELLRGAVRIKDRRQARFFISALQSVVFDQTIVERQALLPDDVAPSAKPLDPLFHQAGAVHWLFAGDLAWVHRTGRLIAVQDPAVHQEELERGEVSPTGWLFGTKAPRAGGEVGALEQRALETWDIPPPRQWRLPFDLRGARRPLRAIPAGLRSDRQGNKVRFELSLAPGAYASVFLSEAIPGIVEGRTKPRTVNGERSVSPLPSLRATGRRGERSG